MLNEDNSTFYAELEYDWSGRMLNAIKIVTIEHKNNLYRIWQMGKSHMKRQTIRTSLGIGWILIRDIVYFTVFILFRYLMSGSHNVDGMHFIVYLITGLIPWFFMNEVINAGAGAIKGNSAIIKSIEFPITIIPTYEVLAIFMKRLFTIVFAFVVIGIFGNIWDFDPLLFIYYFLAMFILMILFNLITSAFIAISQDFNQLYLALTRILFFSLPIIWSFERIQNNFFLLTLLKLNPMTYIIMGFRDAFVLGSLPSLKYTIYFWGICLVLLYIGCYVQYKLRKYYSDFI